MGADFWSVTLGGLLGSGLATGILAALLLRRNARISAEIQDYFEQRQQRLSSVRAYQEAALEQLFGPVKMQMARTGRAFLRWRERNDHIETTIIREGNLFVRDLLLAKGHLIPPHLIAPVEVLIEHYDAWLEQYALLRAEGAASDAPFVFVGPKGFPFPRTAEQLIVAYAAKLQRDLYGEVMLEG
ncbi:MAG: hypothetical protein E6G94_14740 [Alphaproteobacteria bacterium]|nr:MAG: hypothetical protein E6G94_14740 [Alphaproteobacteria bacterium]